MMMICVFVVLRSSVRYDFSFALRLNVVTLFVILHFVVVLRRVCCVYVVHGHYVACYIHLLSWVRVTLRFYVVVYVTFYACIYVVDGVLRLRF